jgi:hypothetical protein
MKRQDSRGVPDLDVLNYSKKSLKCRDSRGVSDVNVSDYLKQNSDFEKYHFILRNISYFFHCFFSVWKKRLQRQWLQLSPQSALGNTLRSKFKKGKLPGKYVGVDANYVKELWKVLMRR